MLKRIINKLGRMSPDSIARLFVHIPFNIRHGKTYSNFEKVIKESKDWNENELEDYIVTHFNKIFQHSKKFKLYQEKYKKSGVFDLEIKNLEDIKRIPILTRNEIREHIYEFDGHELTKTGGTSGNPLPIYSSKNSWAIEWAHYHTIWAKAGYKYTDAKFKFHRPHLTNDFITYNFEHNEYVVNSYKMSGNFVDVFFETLISKNVKYFHGHPSAINDFLKAIEDKVSISQKDILKEQIKCCFYASEMPLPHIVEYLRNVWGLHTISMYGHTEMCVLAATDIDGIDYFPLQTYGYVEVEGKMLLGTSYHNFDMPLIRYNTDDLVRAKRYTNGLLKSFKVTEGRVLDYIVDKNDYRICYVAMFCDKHHEVFKHIDYLQIFQEKKGKATIIISQNKVEHLNAPALMNLDGFDVDFDFVYLNKPIRTNAGKVPLRVKELP